MIFNTSSVLWPRIATIAIFLANGVGIGAWAAAIPGLQRSHELSAARLSLVLLAFAGGAVISMLLAGLAMPALGTRRACVLAGASFALTLLLPPLAPSFLWLVAVAFLLGFTNGAIDVSMNAHASGIERRWGAPIMSSFHAAFSLGGLAGAAIAGFLETRQPGLGLFLSGSLSFLLVMVAGPALGPGEEESATGSGLRLPDRGMWAICAMVLLCMLVEGAMADWSSVYIVSLGDPTLAASGYAAFSLAMAAGRLTGDRIVRLLGPSRVILVGGLTAGVGSMAAAMAPGAFFAVPGFVLIGLGLANVVPVLFSAAARRYSVAATGVAMAASAGYAGFLAGPPALGGVISAFGFRPGIGILALVALTVALLAWRFAAVSQLSSRMEECSYGR